MLIGLDMTDAIKAAIVGRPVRHPGKRIAISAYEVAVLRALASRHSK